MEKVKAILGAVFYGLLLGAILTFAFPALFLQQYYIINDIKSGGSVEYNKLLSRLATAKSPLEVINIEVRSFGGYVDGTSVLINAIKRSNATIRITVNDFVYSGGALLLCHADTLTVLPGADVMYHLPRYNNRKGEIVVVTDPSEDVFKQVDIMFSPCTKYLTSTQLESYYKGNDVYLDANQFKAKK